MVGNNLKDQQLQQIVDKTIMEADKDGDGKLSFEEFALMVSNTVRVGCLLSRWHSLLRRDHFGVPEPLLIRLPTGHCQADDAGGLVLGNDRLRLSHLFTVHPHTLF